MCVYVCVYDTVCMCDIVVGRYMVSVRIPTLIDAVMFDA